MDKDAAKQWLQKWIDLQYPGVSDKNAQLVADFLTLDSVLDHAEQILRLQKMIASKFQLNNRIDEILHLSIPIPNGTVGKPYLAPVPIAELGLHDIITIEFEGIENTGLAYDHQLKQINGTPVQAGDFTVYLLFRINGEAEDSILNRKKLTFVINPDPKSLWKNIPSDPAAEFPKPDDVYVQAALGHRHIVVASRRGRSHANAGTHRDDDFAFKHFTNTGWSIVAIADGAGSAPCSRKGAAVATQTVLDWFEQHEDIEQFDALIAQFQAGADPSVARLLTTKIYEALSQATLFVHNELVELAQEHARALKDFHTTLAFVLFKKYDFGYAMLSFSVGDCPVAMINKDGSAVTLLNWLDVGDFGGGTRFITMPEIFSSEQFSTRFKFKLTEDFSYLFLMTDGIYDPKFEVEAQLNNIDCWHAFLQDLAGNNPEKIQVALRADNPDAALQLSNWMDFWSPGNHDDRTLAIVF